MTKCVSTSHVRALVVVLAAIFAWPAPALATDPATDQYSPSTPGGGGNVPLDGGENDFEGIGGGSGSSSGSGSGGDGGDGGTPVAPAVAAATENDGSASGASAGSSASSRNERTLGALAAQGKAERESQADVAVASGASTDLIRSENDEGSGLGPFFWILLGLTLAGAIALGVSRRRTGGHPA